MIAPRSGPTTARPAAHRVGAPSSSGGGGQVVEEPVEDDAGRLGVLQLVLDDPVEVSPEVVQVLGEFCGVAVERGEEGTVLGVHPLHRVLVERLAAQPAHGDGALEKGGDHPSSGRAVHRVVGAAAGVGTAHAGVQPVEPGGLPLAYHRVVAEHAPHAQEGVAQPAPGVGDEGGVVDEGGADLRVRGLQHGGADHGQRPARVVEEAAELRFRAEQGHFVGRSHGSCGHDGSPSVRGGTPPKRRSRRR